MSLFPQSIIPAGALNPGGDPEPVSCITLLGVRIHALTLTGLLGQMEQAIQSGRKLSVMNVNIHAMNLAHDSAAFRSALNRADLVFCDGFGVLWGARMLGERLPERFTPPDWIPLLGEGCRRLGRSLYFLGARPGVAEKAARRLQEAIPGLEIAGNHHGYFDRRPGSRENEAVLAQVQAARPDYLLVGFGMPAQELWVDENRPRLAAGVTLTVGAAFDYLAGESHRPPQWMTDRGLEWLGRLFYEPRRLWRRYLLGNPVFLYRILRQKLELLMLHR